MFVKFNDEILVKDVDYIIDKGNLTIKQHIFDKYSIADVGNGIKDSMICKYDVNKV